VQERLSLRFEGADIGLDLGEGAEWLRIVRLNTQPVSCPCSLCRNLRAGRLDITEETDIGVVAEAAVAALPSHFANDAVLR
jgi:hypothetical protein